LNDELQEWEERYSRPGYWAGTEPSAILREVLPLLPAPGEALDLACGEGRNAVFLARRGWRVTAVDRSAAGLAKAAKLAREQDIPVEAMTRDHLAPHKSRGGAGKSSVGGIRFIEADLERYSLSANSFDLILCINYLQRSLFRAVPLALRPGAVLLYETYTLDQLSPPNAGREGATLGPRNPAFLLRSGELREAFPGLHLLFYREFTAENARATLLARKP
jgi:SAM-dependent methyltransferase